MILHMSIQNLALALGRFKCLFLAVIACSGDTKDEYPDMPAEYRSANDANN